MASRLNDRKSSLRWCLFSMLLFLHCISCGKHLTPMGISTHPISPYSYLDIKSYLLLSSDMANYMNLQILPLALYCQMHLILFGLS